MTDFEKRLSRDLKEFSERAQPESIRPLREPEARRRPRAASWLAPAAAVAAVLGVIAGVSVIGRPAGVVPTSAPEEQGPMPRYYVTVWQKYGPAIPIGASLSDAGNQGSNRHVMPTYAVVHDSATGAALATVRVPSLTTPSITAAGDDRTFVIMEQSYDPRVNLFYRLRVAANGRSASLTRLPISVPAYLALTDAALSPDGTRLALDVQQCNGKTGSCRYIGIRVVTIATGAVSSWTTRAKGATYNVSWVGNERVAFQWAASVPTPPAGPQAGYRVLTLTGAGRDLMASRPVGLPPPGPHRSVPPTLVTADGKVVVTSAGGKVIELSARTGQVLRVVYTATRVPACDVLSLAPSGIHVLVTCVAWSWDDGNRFTPLLGRVDGDRFTPLQGFPSPPNSAQLAAAW